MKIRVYDNQLKVPNFSNSTQADYMLFPKSKRLGFTLSIIFFLLPTIKYFKKYFLFLTLFLIVMGNIHSTCYVH